MQGSPLSPLLANVALHGLETFILKQFPRRRSRAFNAPKVIRLADDFVILHEDLKVIKACRQLTSAWLKEMGLALKPSKTRITHTLLNTEGETGFEFLGFSIRQYPAGETKSDKDCRRRPLGFRTRIKPSKAAIQRHVSKLREIINRHKHAEQAALIAALNPVIIGWTNYYAHAASARVFQTLGSILYGMLRAWAAYRHPNKGKRWIASKYWRLDEGKGWTFQSPGGGAQLYGHHQTHFRRYVKVRGSRSPYDGDWLYWSRRMGRHPDVPPRVARLLRQQQGKCPECGLFFTDGDVLEVDHILPLAQGGSDAYANRQLLHRHCHDRKTASDKAILVA